MFTECIVKDFQYVYRVLPTMLVLFSPRFINVLRVYLYCGQKLNSYLFIINFFFKAFNKVNCVSSTNKSRLKCACVVAQYSVAVAIVVKRLAYRYCLMASLRNSVYMKKLAGLT